MHSPDDIAHVLSTLTPWRVTVDHRGTDSTPVRAERRGRREVHVRLHRCFGLAAEEVLRDLAQHLQRPSKETAHRLREFVRAARIEVPAGRVRRPTLQPLGRHFDLAEITDALNRAHFGGRLKTRITWGKAAAPRGRRRRSIVFGSYDDATDTVRIHPDLDAPDVPRVFLEYIVFHELLHAVHPIQVRANGRRTIHTTAFRRAERRFPHLAEAMAHFQRWRER